MKHFLYRVDSVASVLSGLCKIELRLWLSVAPMEATGVQRICTDAASLSNDFSSETYSWWSYRLLPFSETGWVKAKHFQFQT